VRVRRPEPARWGVPAITAGVSIIGILLWSLPLTRQAPGSTAGWLSWWMVAVLAALAEIVVLHIHTRREAHALSLSELAVISGLFFAGPTALVAGRLVGSVAVCVLWRRQPPIKVVFNASLIFSESCLAVLTFHAVLGSGALGPRAWAAAIAATTSAAVLSALAVSCVIALVEGGVRLRDLLTETTRGIVAAGSATVIALVGVHALAQSPLAAVPLGVCLALLMVGYRHYAWLWERHLGLERLHRLNQALSSSPAVDDVLLGALAQVRDVARAERAEIVFITADDRQLPVSVQRADGDTLRRLRMSADDAAHPVWATASEGTAVVLPRSTRDPDQRDFLERHGLRDAVLVPLRGDAGVVGVVIAGNHCSEVLSFDEQDIDLLQAVAGQTALALQRSELVDRLRHDAVHDAVTGLPNRARLHHELDVGVARVVDGTLSGLSVVVLDLIDFRQINDVFGSRIADLLLREVGARLAGAVVSPGVVARLGSDEFAVLLPGVADVPAALIGGRRLLATLDSALSVDGIEIEVGASAGLAVAPLHGLDVETLLKRAEAALDAARRAGAGLQAFEARLEPDDSSARLALLGELRHGMSEGQLELFVQPQADPATGAVTGAEALVRWRHPERGLVPPDEFIPLAERSGLIHALTTTVLGEAVALCGMWHRMGHDLSIAVNLSARSVLDPGLSDRVRALLAVHQVPAHRLILEITESSVIDDPARTGEVLDDLHALGVRLSIDDFGTGYSSMTYLRRLPVQEVKIDKSFVFGMAANPDDEAIVRSIIDLGVNLRLDVVAEGVEDLGTWERLHRLGCTTIQGYFLARPMPAPEFLPWLQRRLAAVDVVRAV
jgi:diguanylate cyclase (GGDEF)-like protein